jgi:O-antigen ligase
LIQHRGGVVRVLSLIYFVLAPVAVVLTAARGAFLAGIVALSVIPLSLPRQSVRSVFLVIGLLIGLLTTVSMVVPPAIWARIVTIPTEITGGGGLTGRTDIWKAGVTVFWSHMLLGVGAGAYGTAVQPYTYFPHAPHNMAVGMLVELGVVGFVIFAALLGACALTIWRLPPDERTLWTALMLSWFVGVMSLNFEESKVTWLLYGLLAAQTAAEATRRSIVHPQRTHTVPAARPELLRPVHSRGMAQVSRSR